MKIKKLVKKKEFWIVAVLVIIIAIVGIRSYSILPINEGGFTKTWETNYVNNLYTFKFSGTYQSSGTPDTNVRVEANNCFRVNLYREPYQSNTIPVDEATCNSLGGRIETCTARECYQQKFCHFDSIDFSNYVIISQTNSNGLYFDLEEFKLTKQMIFCNPTANKLPSFSINVVLGLDSDRTYYSKSTKCESFTKKISQKTAEDYEVKDDCLNDLSGTGKNPNNFLIIIGIIIAITGGLAYLYYKSK